MQLSEQEIKNKLAERLPDMAKALSKGLDIEVRKDREDVKVISLDKRVIEK